MAKKNKKGNELGKSLIRDRFSHLKNQRPHQDKLMLHTTDLNDGYDWGRLNLQSVTEVDSFQDFLSTAELAGTEFQAEKLNIQFVNTSSGTDIVSRSLNELEEKHIKLLKVPRRPPWNEKTTPEELSILERDSFLEWRHKLAMLQEEDGFLLTPYERNLEFWRQLWRVIERSDIVVQILDARNPLMFRCEDLETYVKEVSKNKENILLLNKADFLTEHQRQVWADHFNKHKLKVIFFSAIAENTNEDETANVKELMENLNLDPTINTSKLYTKEELIMFFRTYHKAPRVTENVTTVGLVGYPNVGKSSTINCLLSAKKVSVSATPGKTKHFQTHFIDEDILLCDCPGLVMPSFVSSKAEMVTSGILPIDQMRDHVPPVTLVTSLIPRHVFENRYGLILPKPREDEDQDRPPTSEELLNAYGYNRGYMTQNGQPDNPRSARYVLKDFVNGKLLYCHAPPDYEQKIFHVFEEKIERSLQHANPDYIRAIKTHQTSSSDVDSAFFQSSSSGAHEKGVKKLLATSNLTDSDAKAIVMNNTSKPWREANKHGNKKKKEKLRRVYAHLDQH